MAVSSAPTCLQQAGGTSCYEFYPFYEGPLTLAAINRKLAQYPHCYNYYRPHDGIGLQTPACSRQAYGVLSETWTGRLIRLIGIEPGHFMAFLHKKRIEYSMIER